MGPISPTPAALPISPVRTQATRISPTDLADTRAAGAPWDRASEAMKNGPHSDNGLKVKAIQSKGVDMNIAAGDSARQCYLIRSIIHYSECARPVREN